MVCNSSSTLFIETMDIDDLYPVSVWHLKGSAIGDGYIARICLYD